MLGGAAGRLLGRGWKHVRARDRDDPQGPAAPGCEVGSLADLRRSGVRYRDAIPVLVDWLGRVSDPKVKGEIACGAVWVEGRALPPLLRWAERGPPSCPGGIMIDVTPLHEALLELGLEDWIPLPEILDTPEVRPCVEEGRVVGLVSRALVDLVAQDRIQVWFGHWSADPGPAPRELAEELLLDERRYSFGAEDAGLDRVYVVNVANFRAE